MAVVVKRSINTMKLAHLMKMQIASAKADLRPWKLDIRLVDGTDFFQRFDTMDEANSAALRIFRAGYAIRFDMPKEGPARVDYFPIHNIRQLSIYESRITT